VLKSEKRIDPSNMSSKVKHLEFILSVVDRMAKNSFLLKSWAATLITGFTALSAGSFSRGHVYFSITLLVSFALLDSYYLSKERAFRDLYDDTRVKDEADIDYSLNIKHLLSFSGWAKSTFSASVLLFYGGLFIAQLLLIFNLT